MREGLGDTKPRVPHQDTHDNQVLGEPDPLDRVIPRKLVNPVALSPHDVLRLQSTIGNQAVMRVLNRVNKSSSARPRSTNTSRRRSKQGITQDPSADIVALPETAGPDFREVGAMAVQRDPVPTDFGTFKDEEYTEINEKGGKGVHIKLSFEPNMKVDATKIGIAQSIRTFEEDKSFAIDPKLEKLMVNKPGSSKGYRMDPVVGSTNPMMGVKALDRGDASRKDLSASEMIDPKKHQFGWRSKTKDPPVQKAIMQDTPQAPTTKSHSGELFETTALAIEGAQKGTYYGSVSWGWTLDGAGKYAKQPLSLESKGDPTSKFLDAAKLWNEFDLPAKVERIGKTKQYRVKEPLTVSLKIGTDADNSVTLPVGSVLTLAGSEADDKIKVSIGQNVSFAAAHIFVNKIPIDQVNEKTMVVQTDTAVTIGGVSVTVKAGTTLRDFSVIEQFQVKKYVAGMLDQGSIVLPPDTESSIAKGAVTGVKYTKLPIPAAKRKSGATAVQRKPVETDFGTFNDEEYKPVDEKDRKGLEMTLSFEPKDKVDATKIGMVQSVNAYKRNKSYARDSEYNKQYDKRMAPTAGASKGYQIDVPKDQTNPIYGAQNLASGADLSASTFSDSTEGWRSASKKPPMRKAEMSDTPHITHPPKDSGQVFETAALAVEGAQKGTYYGSVSWGWTLDSAGKYHQQDLKLAAKGDPTAKFLDAAKAWNAFDLPQKVEPTGKPKEYRVKEPLNVDGKFGVLTLGVGSLLTLTGSEAGDKIKVSIGPGVSLSHSQTLVNNIPKDNVDTKTKTVKKDTPADISGTGLSVTIKAGSKFGVINDLPPVNGVPSVRALLEEGTIELPSKMEGSIDKAAVEGAKTTKLPISGKK